MSTAGELRLLVARLLSEESEQLVHIGFVGVLNLQGARERKPGSRPFHLADDGLRSIVADQRDLRTEPGNLSDRIEIENQILVQGHAPALNQIRQRIIVGDFGAPELQRRIHHQQRAPATLDVFLDRVDFGLLVVAGRSRDDQDWCSRLEPPPFAAGLTVLAS